MKKFEIQFHDAAGVQLFATTVETEFGFKHASSLAIAAMKQAKVSQTDALTMSVHKTFVPPRIVVDAAVNID